MKIHVVAFVGLIWSGLLYASSHGEPRASKYSSFFGALVSAPGAAATTAEAVGGGLLSLGAAGVAIKQWSQLMKSYRGQDHNPMVNMNGPMMTSSSNQVSAFKRLRGFRFFRRPNRQPSVPQIQNSNDAMELMTAAAGLPPGAIIENPWERPNMPHGGFNFGPLNAAPQTNVPTFSEFNPTPNLGVPGQVNPAFGVAPNELDLGVGHVHVADRPGQFPNGYQQHLALTAPRRPPLPNVRGRGNVPFDYTELFGGPGAVVDQTPALGVVQQVPPPQFGYPAQAQPPQPYNPVSFPPQSPRPPRTLQANVAYRPPPFQVYNELSERPQNGPVQPQPGGSPPPPPPPSQPLGGQVYGPQSPPPPPRPVETPSEEPRELPSPNYLPQPPRTTAQRVPPPNAPNRVARVVYSQQRGGQIVPSIEYYPVGETGQTNGASQTPANSQSYSPSIQYEEKPQSAPSSPNQVRPKYSRLLQNSEFKPSSGPAPQRTQSATQSQQSRLLQTRPGQVLPSNQISQSQSQVKAVYTSPYSRSYGYPAQSNQYSGEYKSSALRQVSSSMGLQVAASEKETVIEDPKPEYRVLDGNIRLLGHLGSNGATHLNGPINVNGVEGLVTLSGRLVPAGQLEATGQINIRGLISNFTLRAAVTPESIAVVNGRVINPPGSTYAMAAKRSGEEESSPNALPSYTSNVQQILLNGTVGYSPAKYVTTVRLNGTIGLLGAVSPASVRALVNDDGVIRVDAVLGNNAEQQLEEQIRAQLEALKRQLALSLLPNDPLSIAPQLGLKVTDGVPGSFADRRSSETKSNASVAAKSS